MNLGISKALDYDIYSYADRAQFVKDLFNKELSEKAALHYEEDSTAKELEAAANYILYGKNPKTDKNFCQTKEIQIDPKHTTWTRKQAESLDALLENPATNQEHFMELKKSPYKKVKPTISRDPDGPDAQIPGMKDLWVAIDRLAERVKELKDQNLLNLEYYKKNHLLIALRKEQFVLKGSQVDEIRAHTFAGGERPDICLTSDTGYVRDNYQIFKYGNWRADHYRSRFGEDWYAGEQEKLATLIRDGLDKWEWVEVSENRIDLTNPLHIYHMIEMYGTLKENSWDRLDSDLKFLLWELETYIDNTEFDESRFWILCRKIERATNEQIADELQLKYGLGYSPNYISTIFTKQICEKIAKTAVLMYDMWNWREHPEKFKKCSTCGKTYFRDERSFVKKANAKDGLSARCKHCDKKARDKKKEGSK